MAKLIIHKNTRVCKSNKWLKVEGSANSIHIENKLYYALATKKKNIYNYDDEFDILKKVIFLDILFIGSYNII